jgi:CBS domain-containing protein
MTLREVLHAHIPWLSPESTVRDAIDKMDVYQFPALVVANKDMKPLAVLTEGDLCRAVAHRDSLTSMATEPALIYGSSDPVTATPDLEIGEAFHKMRTSGLTVLPIVEFERLIGIVLRVDLMQALLLDINRANETPS